MGIVVVRLGTFSTRTMPSSVQAKTVDTSVGVVETKSDTIIVGDAVGVPGVLGGDVAVGTDVLGCIGVGALDVPLGGPLPDVGAAAGSCVGEGSVGELGERVGGAEGREPGVDGEGATVDGAIDMDIDMVSK